MGVFGGFSEGELPKASDIGGGHGHCLGGRRCWQEFASAHVLGVSGREMLYRKIENDEAYIRKLIDEILSSSAP